MSLQIRINGETLDMAPRMKADLDLVSPYLVFEDVFSSKATIPALPTTPRNRRILGYPDLLQNDDVSFRYTAEKYYNGQLLQRGIAILTEAAERFALTVVQPLGELLGDYQRQLLTEIDFGSVTLPVGALTPVVIQDGRQVCCFPTVINPDYFGSNGASVGYSGRMNHYTAGAYSTTATEPKVPMFFLKEILRRISELTGVQIIGDFLAHPALQNLIFYNTRSLDGATSIKIQQHLPDLTPAALLLELRKLFCLAMDINAVDRVIRLDFLGPILAAPAALDWSKKAIKQYRKRPEAARRIQLGSEIDSGDGLQKDKPADVADYFSPVLDDDTGLSKLSTKFSTLLTDSSAGLAITKQTGITNQFGQSGQRFAPRLLFWNGMQATPGGTLPVATARNGGYSLYWNGDGGLADLFWKEYELFRQRMYYLERELFLDEIDLATLDFSQKIHINGVDYLILNLKATLPIRGPVSALLVRV